MTPDKRPLLTDEDRKQVEDFIEMINEKILPRFTELSQARYLDEDEKKELLKVTEIISKAVPIIEKYRLILNSRLLDTANDFYFHVRNLALKGDESAKVIYEDLKVYYVEMKNESLNDNLN